MMFKQKVNSSDLVNRYPAIFAESEKENLSDKYLYIPTYKLLQGLESQGFEIIGAKQQGTRSNNREHAKHVVYLSHPSLNQEKALKVGEELPMIALTNSHNGLSSFAIDTAFFRLACSNGLLMPTTKMNSARIVHKIGMQNDVIEAATRVVQEFPEQVRKINEMKNIALNRDEQMLLADSASRLVFEDDQLDLNKERGVNIPLKMLHVRRSQDTAQNLWTTFNVIQENIIKGGHRVLTQNEQGQRSITKMRPVKSIDRDAKLNRELMRLAQEMAKIKTA